MSSQSSEAYIAPCLKRKAFAIFPEYVLEDGDEYGPSPISEEDADARLRAACVADLLAARLVSFWTRVGRPRNTTTTVVSLSSLQTPPPGMASTWFIVAVTRAGQGQ